MGRALRRHHKFRMRRRAQRMYEGTYLGPRWEDAWKFADSLPICSCYMCGNPRRHRKEKPRQEILADLSKEEQLLDYLWVTWDGYWGGFGEDLEEAWEEEENRVWEWFRQQAEREELCHDLRSVFQPIIEKISV